MKKYGIIIGIGILLLVTSVYAASILSSSEVTYDNSNSGLEATTVQEALDEVYRKVKNGRDCTDSNCNILLAYQYNEDSCITGEEETCKLTTCYKNKVANSCHAGTIIKYKVNDVTEKYFYVLHDDGEVMTLQQRENTVYNTAWHTVRTSINGPITILEELENATNNWSNVNIQTYTMGTTTFHGSNSLTGCELLSEGISCNKNTYTLDKKNSRVRMITLQEAMVLGCTIEDGSCPIWMYNYLSTSTSYGGTINVGSTDNWAYWTMSADSSQTELAWNLGFKGGINRNNTDYASNSARAVVVINK